jgi:hypothetical protein
VRRPGLPADPRRDRRHGGPRHRPGRAADHAPGPRGDGGRRPARRDRLRGRHRRAGGSSRSSSSTGPRRATSRRSTSSPSCPTCSWR